MKFSKSREKVIKFYNDYFKMVPKAAYDPKHGKGPKILTPTQMFQRLPIALAQIKAGNTSEKLLNQIGQIIYLLYREKQITKKVYNNIMNSIKV